MLMDNFNETNVRTSVPLPPHNAARRAWLKGLKPGDAVAVADFAEWLTPALRYEICPIAGREGQQVLVSTGDGATAFSAAGTWTCDESETPSYWLVPVDAEGVRESVQLQLAADSLGALGQGPGLAALNKALANEDDEVRAAAERLIARAAIMQADMLTVRAAHR
jgi:hypothetical protein